MALTDTGTVGSSQVCLYIPTFAGGGAERVFVRLANYMCSVGHRVTMVVNSTNGPLQKLLSPDVEVHALNVSRPLRMLALAGYIRRHNPPLIISAMTRTNMMLILAKTLSGAPTRTVISERNQYSVLNARLPPWKQKVMRWLVRWTYRRANQITAVAGGVADDISIVAGLPRSVVKVIYNPAPDIEELEAARHAPSPHPWLETNVPVIVAIGRLIPQKDYDTMLGALAKVREKMAVRLIVLGDGPEESRLCDLAQRLGIGEAVEFVGFQMNRFEFLVRADLFVLSSITEGFPNALIEAVSAGVPVISTDCAGNGPKEILGEASSALVPVGDADALAAAIQRELSTPTDASTIKLLASRFAMHAISDAFLTAGQS